MATPLSTYSAFALNNRPSVVEFNRNGAANLSGASLPGVVAQHWVPSLDNTYDLGQNTTPLRWRDLWLSRNASVVGTTTTGGLSVANNAIFTNGPLYVGPGGLSNYNSSTPNIGTTGSGRWGALYITTINTTGLITTAAINVTSLAVTGTAPAMFSGFLLPSNSAALDLGSSSLAWRDLYITGNIYKNGVLYNPGMGALGDLIPATNNTYDIGSISNQWKNGRFAGDIYCNNLYATNNIEATNGNLSVVNGSGSFGTNLTVGASGVGSITVSGSVIVVGTNAVRPSVSGQGSVGTNTLPWGDVWSNSARANIVSPITNGAPVASTNVGTLLSQYQNGYIQNMNTTTMVPTADNTGAVGSAILRYAAGYFNNLYLTALPTSSFLASGTSTPPTPVTSGTPGFTITGTTSNSTLQWTRVGSIYTVSYQWRITVSSGWVATTNYSRIDVLVDLPFTREVSGPTYGVCSGGPEHLPTFFGAISPPLGQDNKFYMTFRDVTLPALTISGNVVTFQCIFQCNRIAA